MDQSDNNAPEQHIEDNHEEIGIINLVSPEPLPAAIQLLPDPNSMEFTSLLGLELVVDYLSQETNSATAINVPNKDPFPTLANTQKLERKLRYQRRSLLKDQNEQDQSDAPHVSLQEPSPIPPQVASTSRQALQRSRKEIPISRRLSFTRMNRCQDYHRKLYERDQYNQLLMHEITKGYCSNNSLRRNQYLTSLRNLSLQELQHPQQLPHLQLEKIYRQQHREHYQQLYLKRQRQKQQQKQQQQQQQYQQGQKEAALESQQKVQFTTNNGVFDKNRSHSTHLNHEAPGPSFLQQQQEIVIVCEEQMDTTSDIVILWQNQHFKLNPSSSSQSDDAKDSASNDETLNHS